MYGIHINIACEEYLFICSVYDVLSDIGIIHLQKATFLSLNTTFSGDPYF